MTVADKFGIALAIGITIAFVAIAMGFASTGTTTSTQVSIPTPVQVPTPAPAPAPVETPVPTPEPSPVPVETPVETPSAVDVSVSKGSSSPGCETNNECFEPGTVTVSVGGTVTWTNNDAAAHTVTSGSASDGPDGTFDSSIFMSKKTFEHTFDKAGTYDYFCVVHPWMTGKVTVE